MAGDSRLTTENFLKLNFSPNSGITPGTNDLLNMDCDQIKSRYNVTVSGVSTTGTRLPGQNQLATAAAPAVVSISVGSGTFVENGVMRYTLTLTAVAAAQVTGTVYFELDFLSGSVPAGQSEARSASITKIPEAVTVFTGAGTIRSFTNTFAAGTTTTTFDLRFYNDNWDSPIPISSFRLRLTAGSGTTLSVANSTVTNGSTFVASQTGILTTFLTLTEINSSRGISGDMVYFRINSSSYNSSQKTMVQALGTFNTSSYDTNKSFVSMVVDTNDFNYTPGDVYRHLDNALFNIGSFNAYNTGVYVRYYIRNVSGSTSNFAMTISQYKYCSFSNSSYSGSIASLNIGNIISIYSSTLSGTDTWSVPRIQVFPGATSLLTTDTFTYKYVVHCPTGGYVNFYRTGNGVPYYDGQEITGTYSPYYAFDSVKFFGGALSSSSSNVANTTIAFSAVPPSQYFIFTQSDQWVDLVPISSNIVTSSLYPHKLNSGGVF